MMHLCLACDRVAPAMRLRCASVASTFDAAAAADLALDLDHAMEDSELLEIAAGGEFLANDWRGRSGRLREWESERRKRRSRSSSSSSTTRRPRLSAPRPKCSSRTTNSAARMAGAHA